MQDINPPQPKARRRIRPIKSILMPFCLAILLPGCLFDKGEDLFAKRFFNSTPAYQDQLKRMETFPLEAQYQVYLYGMQHIQPAPVGLAEPIAKRGQAAVPFLLAKLISAPNDRDVGDVIFIFQFMKLLDCYDTGQDQGLIGAINGRIAKIKSKNKVWKKLAVAMLNDLKSNRARAASSAGGCAATPQG